MPAPRILLHSSWQTVNIGDIGHTPGVLTLLETLVPEAEVWLWPRDAADGVAEMLQRRFPRMRLLVTEAAIAEGIANCDLLLHGSGPYVVGHEAIERWQAASTKPVVIYGVTLPRERVDAAMLALLTRVDYIGFRDRVSLAVGRQLGLATERTGFIPDGAFAVDLRDDARAEAFLAANGLETGRFVCAIGRLRITPYWLIPGKSRPFNAVAQARNAAMEEQDHAPLCEAIIRIVRETGLKVLLCPEDATQMEVNRRMQYERLPADVRANVVWREQYWLTDEALSTYVRSAGIIGHEMHSPIMALGNGVPALVARWEEQTSKGAMWRDIGLGDWLFDFDQAEDRARYPAAAVAWARTLGGTARTRVSTAQAVVTAYQRASIDRVRALISLPAAALPGEVRVERAAAG